MSQALRFCLRHQEHHALFISLPGSLFLFSPFEKWLAFRNFLTTAPPTISCHGQSIWKITEVPCASKIQLIKTGAAVEGSETFQQHKPEHQSFISNLKMFYHIKAFVWKHFYLVGKRMEMGVDHSLAIRISVQQFLRIR